MKKKQGRGLLRCCGRCQWIFASREDGCPKCDFASYSAHYVFGKRAYSYALTQKPWFDIKMGEYAAKLLSEVEAYK
jgi:hypothetical protein